MASVEAYAKFNFSRASVFENFCIKARSTVEQHLLGMRMYQYETMSTVHEMKD